MLHDISLNLVGCGAMGGALLKGWIKHDAICRVNIIEPEQATVEAYLENHKVHWVSPEQKHELDFEGNNVLFFAVKPQIMPQIIDEYRDLVTDHTLVMTIAAGLSMDFYQQRLGDNVQVVRVMPNTPAFVASAVSGMLANNNLTVRNKDLADYIMQLVGITMWRDSDKDIDKLTAVSGCGPAYMFYLVEALSASAQRLGFSEEEACLLAKETFVGSAKYFASVDVTAKQLRQQVTSPGGMTEAGLKVLQHDKRFFNAVDDAVHAAFQHSKELKK